MKKIIDLTYLIEEGMTTFNAYWHAPVEISQLGRYGFEGRETRKILFGTHTSTHVDAPRHFVKQGQSIEAIPLDKLIGPVTILNFSYLSSHSKNRYVTGKMLSKLELAKKVVFKFGWGKYWGDKKFYQNYPFFSPEAACYLVDKKVELVAMDTPSPDDPHISLKGEVLGSPQDSPVHKLFLENKVILVEYLANLDQVKEYKNWNLSVMPLKIKDADGSPARVCIFK